MVKEIQAISRSEMAYQTLQAHAEQVEDKLEFAGVVAGAACSSVVFANHFKPIPKEAMSGLDHTRFIGIASGLFEIPRFLSEDTPP